MKITKKQIDEAFIGYNSGVMAMSRYRGEQPLLIAGCGRGGTTAMMSCFWKSGGHIVTSQAEEGCNLEDVPFNRMIQGGRWREIYSWAERIRKEYCEYFVVKSPMAEVRFYKEEEAIEAWTNRNMIVMVRDPVAVALRELSVQGNKREESKHLIVECSRRLTESLEAACKLSRHMGLAVVSYEKLLVNPGRCAKKINEWAGRSLLSEEGCNLAIDPNNDSYLRRQTRSVVLNGE